MKSKKTKINKSPWTELTFFFVTLVLLILLILIILPDTRQEFIVTKEVNGKIIDLSEYIKENELWINENISFFLPRDGVEWLDENFRCVKISCTFSYNDSQRAKLSAMNASFTWYGPIMPTESGSVAYYKPGATMIQECQPCEEYQYGNYTIFRK